MLCRSGMSLLAGRPGSLFERSIGWMHRLRFVFAFVEWVPRSKSLLKKKTRMQSPKSLCVLFLITSQA